MYTQSFEHLNKVGARDTMDSKLEEQRSEVKFLGPVVQSVVSLTSSLRVISLTVLADSIHNILLILAEKM